jgi:hypothetical protein
MKLRSGRAIGSSRTYSSRTVTPKAMVMNLKRSMSKVMEKKGSNKGRKSYHASLEVSPILMPAKLQDNVNEALRMAKRKKDVEEIKELMKKKK